MNTSNIKFIMLLDPQAAHIYTYMGQNILNFLVFSFMSQTPFFLIGEGKENTESV